MKASKTLVMAVTILILLVSAACGAGQTTTSGGESGGAAELSLVAYSTPREAYEEIIPAFAKTEAGKGVTFAQSYASSGEQSRKVEQGLEADVVAFSLESDVARLVRAGVVAEDWNGDEFKGMVTNSVVVLAVREGNPKGIKGWDDLVKPGVEVITPNPITSGGARWNVMAAYGAQTKQGKSETEATEYLRRMFANVSVQDKSAREALNTFVGGKGDVMIAYENEVLTAREKGEKVEYVIPDQTILIENPVAATSNSKHPDQAKAFVNYLRTADAQRVFAQKGYRPVLDDVRGEFAQYKDPATLFTIADLGGWSDVTAKFFDPDSGVVAKVQQGQ